MRNQSEEFLVFPLKLGVLTLDVILLHWLRKNNDHLPPLSCTSSLISPLHALDRILPHGLPCGNGAFRL